MKASFQSPVMPLRFLLALVCCGALVTVGGGCRLFAPGPAQTLRQVFALLEAGRIEEATAYYSTAVVSAAGTAGLKSNLSAVPTRFQLNGGIKHLNVERENIVGEVGEVQIAINYDNGFVEHPVFKFLREAGGWKIDGAAVSTDAPSNMITDAAATAPSPRYPERAV